MLTGSSLPVSGFQESKARRLETGFESAVAGPIRKLNTGVGLWESVSGRTLVEDRHARTGKHCLQLTGGEETILVLHLPQGSETSGVLTFWAERWTRRQPFSFRIEKNIGSKEDGWKEIYRGDQTLQVGRSYLSQVRIPLRDPLIQRLRFRVVSPPDTGVLIDDLKIVEPKPQKIVSVRHVPHVVPALVGRVSPLMRLEIETEGELNPIALSGLKGKIAAPTVLEDLDSLSLYFGGSSDDFRSAAGVADLKIQKDGPREFQLACSTDLPRLGAGVNHLWIAGRINRSADIDHRIAVVTESVSFANSRSVRLDDATATQRLGIGLRDRGHDGVHTYRIPGLATTNRGTLIAVYDVRHRSGRDLPGDIDVGMSRSTDGGRTWEPMRIIMDMGDDPRWNHDGIGDPAILVDRKTGTIWVAGTWSHGNRSWNGSGPGLTPNETGQLMLVRSDDDGRTWSKPINVTKQVKDPGWCFLLQGPGKGITMSDGTLVFAAQFQDTPENKRLPRSTILYSRDHGKSWAIGTGAFDDTTESQVVELEPGVLMLNCRYNRENARVVMVTRDMGKTWQAHPTSRRALIEPRACMASLINVDRELDRDCGGWLLFSNPDSKSARQRITIKASPDNGRSWPRQHRLLLDQDRSAGYSCMSMIDDQTLGILYEGSQSQLTFQRIPLADVIGSRPSKKHPAPESKPEPRSDQNDLTVAPVFASHMVLQAWQAIPIRGTGPPGKNVTVELGEERRTTVVDRSGNWSLTMGPRAVCRTPVDLVVKCGAETNRLTDILVGEVWICAGQSNMEWMVKDSTHATEELRGDVNESIRLLHLKPGARGIAQPFHQRQLARLDPEAYFSGSWTKATPDQVAEFSAVGWCFCKELQRKLEVPVGMICMAVGGSPTESWISRDVLASSDRLSGFTRCYWLDNSRIGEFCRERGIQNLLPAIQDGESIPGDELGPNHPYKPGFLWSAGIQPLVPLPVRGVIWYQGESNAESLDQVRDHDLLFPALVSSWRQAFQVDDLPFLYVQLPAIRRPNWPWFRESQRLMLDRLKNVGMAVTIDLGHPTNVHPPLKKPVGHRLAVCALSSVYHHPDYPVPTGPLPSSYRRIGNRIRISFSNTGDGLVGADNQPIRHFEVLAPNGKFVPAKSEIVSKNELDVWNDFVKQPRQVRYAWVAYPDPPVNLVNRSALPASPFVGPMLVPTGK